MGKKTFLQNNITDEAARQKLGDTDNKGATDRAANETTAQDQQEGQHVADGQVNIKTKDNISSGVPINTYEEIDTQTEEQGQIELEYQNRSHCYEIPLTILRNGLSIYHSDAGCYENFYLYWQYTSIYADQST